MRKKPQPNLRKGEAGAVPGAARKDKNWEGREHQKDRGQDASEKAMAVMAGMEDLFSNPLPSFHPKDLLIRIGCGIMRRLVYFKAKNAKKFRHGMEYGSARWGNAKDIEPYVDPVFENNVPYADAQFLCCH